MWRIVIYYFFYMILFYNYACLQFYLVHLVSFLIVAKDLFFRFDCS